MGVKEKAAPNEKKQSKERKPPKEKEPPKGKKSKQATSACRNNLGITVSEVDALLQLPADVDDEGFQERIRTGIEWTFIEQAAMYHKKKHAQEMPPMGFQLAFQKKIKKSLIRKFLDTDTNLTLEELWCYIIPLHLYDNYHASDEGKICFLEKNGITDNCLKIIKKSVLANDRQVLWDELKRATVLRCLFAKITELDAGVLKYRFLKTLNLSGNYLRTIDSSCLPPTLCALELQSNFIHDLNFVANLPQCLMYLGLSRNLIDDDVVDSLCLLQSSVIVLDLSDNDICILEQVLEPLSQLSLEGLLLAGNPCSVCMSYAKTTLLQLTTLQYLDSREVLKTDRPFEKYPPSEVELRATYFTFSVLRVLNAPQAPMSSAIPRDAVLTYHIEVELPLLDSTRRRWLMYRNNSSLTEFPSVEETDSRDDDHSKKSPVESEMETHNKEENGEQVDNIFDELKRIREVILHYTIFETNKVSWNKTINFSDPVVRIFCPDLVALRDTFRSVITIRLVFKTHVMRMKPSKGRLVMKPVEMGVVLATIKCHLRRLDWTQRQQHFHWSENMDTNDALHWGNGDLSAITYVTSPTTKGPKQNPTNAIRENPMPECLTCHFGFGIETNLR